MRGDAAARRLEIGLVIGLLASAVAYRVWESHCRESPRSGVLRVLPGPPPAELSAGGTGTCMRSTTGSVYCWGRENPPAERLQIIEASTDRGPQRLVLGEDLGCLLRDEQNSTCWGLGWVEAPTSERMLAELAALAPRLIRVSVDYNTFGCGLDRERRLWCWGRPSEWGRESVRVVGPVTSDLGPTLVDPGPFADVAVNARMVCVLDPSKRVRCWSRRQPFAAFEPVEGGTDVEEVAAVGAALCVRKTSGEIRCGGRPFTDELYPHSLRSFASLPLASSFVLQRELCILDGIGSVHCDDGEDRVELGAGPFVQLVSGPSGVCLRDSRGTMRCTGPSISTTPAVGMEDLHGASAVALGSLCDAQAQCMLTSDGAVSCRLRRARSFDYERISVHECDLASGQTIVRSVPRPHEMHAAPFPGRSEWVVRGPDQSCASDLLHQVVCWDDGPGARPHRAPELDGMTRLAFGADHGCGIRAGRVRCFGADHMYQLRIEDRTAPVTELALGANHSCVLDALTRRVACAGDDIDGQSSGSGRPAPPQRAAEIPGVDQAIQITAGVHHTCALISGGSVLCWGRNVEGQASPRASRSPIAPTLVELPGPASAVSAGGTSTCAIVRGSVYCWGTLSGEAGRPPSVERVSGAKGVVSLATGSNHACAATRTDTYCWGDSSAGQLGPNPPYFEGECSAQNLGCFNPTPLPSPMEAHRVFGPRPRRSQR